MTIKHKFHSAISDGANPTQVQPSNWNDDHDIKQLVSPQTVVTFSNSPTFDASLGNNFKITLTGNVTSSVLSNALAGQIITFQIIQDGSGNHTFIWPPNVVGGINFADVVLSPNTIVVQSFYFDGTNAYALTPGMVN